MKMHLRLLLALPLLIMAELVVHQRMRQVVRQFVGRGLTRTRRGRSSMLRRLGDGLIAFAEELAKK